MQQAVQKMNQELDQKLDNMEKATGIKHDQGKPDLTLLNIWAQQEIAKVFEFGANKYGRYNYRKGMKWTRIASASLRHINAWVWGEDKDPESGLSHLAHAGCCIFMLLDYEVNKIGEDNRE